MRRYNCMRRYSTGVRGGRRAGDFHKGENPFRFTTNFLHGRAATLTKSDFTVAHPQKNRTGRQSMAAGFTGCVRFFGGKLRRELFDPLRRVSLEKDEICRDTFWFPRICPGFNLWPVSGWREAESFPQRSEKSSAGRKGLPLTPTWFRNSRPACSRRLRRGSTGRCFQGPCPCRWRRRTPHPRRCSRAPSCARR